MVPEIPINASSHGSRQRRHRAGVSYFIGASLAITAHTDMVRALRRAIRNRRTPTQPLLSRLERLVDHAGAVSRGCRTSVIPRAAQPGDEAGQRRLATCRTRTLTQPRHDARPRRRSGACFAAAPPRRVAGGGGHGSRALIAAPCAATIVNGTVVMARSRAVGRCAESRVEGTVDWTVRLEFFGTTRRSIMTAVRGSSGTARTRSMSSRIRSTWRVGSMTTLLDFAAVWTPARAVAAR